MSGVRQITPVVHRPVPEVVRALEEALAEAREGRLRNVAIVADAASGDLFYHVWGLENNLKLVGLLERVKHSILTDIEFGCDCE